jgi:hypothetical protein
VRERVPICFRSATAGQPPRHPARTDRGPDQRERVEVRIDPVEELVKQGVGERSASKRDQEAAELLDDLAEGSFLLNGIVASASG